MYEYNYELNMIETLHECNYHRDHVRVQLCSVLVTVANVYLQELIDELRETVDFR